MTICKELEYLQKVQNRCIRFYNYLEKYHPGRYEDLEMQLSSLIGKLEDTIHFDE